MSSSPLSPAAAVVIIISRDEAIRPYLKVIAAYDSRAVYVLHRYDVMSEMNQAIDEVRAEETKSLKRKATSRC